MAIKESSTLTHALRAVQVSYSYVVDGQEPLEVVKGLSLSVAPRQISAIMGPSGCGKTTILRLIAGVLEPDEGQIIIKGPQETANNPTRIKRCGYVPQNYALCPWLTVRKNIEFGSRFNVQDAAAIKSRASDLINQLGLKSFENAYPKSLSGGMQQRTAIGRALAIAPSMLLLDEPFGALDVRTRTEVQNLLAEILENSSDANRSALFVTHDVAEAIFLADVIFLMSSRPTRVAKEVEIPFGRPRHRDIRESGAFGAIHRMITSEILGAQYN